MSFLSFLLSFFLAFYSFCSFLAKMRRVCASERLGFRTLLCSTAMNTTLPVEHASTTTEVDQGQTARTEHTWIRVE